MGKQKPRPASRQPTGAPGASARGQHQVRRQRAASAATVEVRRLNAELEQRVRSRTAQLEAINRELEAFSYSVSHDLRAPLRAVNGFGTALLEDYADRLDAPGRDLLERLLAAGERMTQLIDALLELSRLSRREMTRESVDLSALARAIVADLRASHPWRGVTFDVEDGLLAQGDSRLLRLALENLLANAWKFTSRHTQALIELKCRPGEDSLVYFVRDDGAGFNMNMADKLFGAFQRLHRADEFEGTGIGLATVQRVIHRHGGRVWAEGEVEKGATFYFTLP